MPLRMQTPIIILALALASVAFAKPFVSSSSIAEALEDPSLQSAEGFPIPLISTKTRAHHVTSGATSGRFLVQGGLHGDEGLTVEFVTWLAARVTEGQSLLNGLPSNTAIDFVPVANPDSFRKSRYNAAGVNLNRNFGVLWGISREPFGPSAFSEPETRAIRALMSSRGYTAAIDVHGFVNWVVTPSSGRHISNASKEKTTLLEKWAQAAKRFLPTLGAYELKDAGSLGDGGAFEDWAFWGNDTLALCLEMHSHQRFQRRAGLQQDTFLAYESYIFNMFAEALVLTKQTAPVVIPTKALTADAH